MALSFEAVPLAGVKWKQHFDSDVAQLQGEVKRIAARYGVKNIKDLPPQGVDDYNALILDWKQHHKSTNLLKSLKKIAKVAVSPVLAMDTVLRKVPGYEKVSRLAPLYKQREAVLRTAHSVANKPSSALKIARQKVKSGVKEAIKKVPLPVSLPSPSSLPSQLPSADVQSWRASPTTLTVTPVPVAQAAPYGYERQAAGPQAAAVSQAQAQVSSPSYEELVRSIFGNGTS